MAAIAIAVVATPAPLPSRRGFRLRSLPTSTASKSPISRYSTRKAGALLVSALGRRIGGGWKEEEEEEEEEEEGLTPFDRMRKWMRKKPAGFGEGKTFDVSLEEELLEEMERSRKAQASNMNKLKGCRGGTVEVSQKQQQKKELPQTKVLDVPPSGVRVRIGNLPKKRNIHRDLESAFKVFPGINNIIPATTGNRKTRDPVCRGFAFVDFESEEVANRFVKTYSKQRLAFGKVEKQIACHMLSSFNSSSKSMSGETTVAKKDTCLESNVWTLKCHKDENPTGYNKNELNEIELLQVRPDNFPQPSSQPGDKEISIESSDKKRVGVPKIKTNKTKPQKDSKVNMSGSANRLKVKERHVLMDAFSRYGGKAIVSSK